MPRAAVSPPAIEAKMPAQKMARKERLASVSRNSRRARRGLQVGNARVRPERGGEDGNRHDARGDDPVALVALAIEHADGMRRIRLQQHGVREQRDAEPAAPAEEEAGAQDRGALVVLGGELWDERGARDLVDGDAETD